MSEIPLRDDYDSAELRTLARRSKDTRQVRRLLALAAIYDGKSRAEAARTGGMDRQTLRDWVHRFNAEGPEGLTNRAGAGRPRRLTDAQMQELAEIVETGPDPAVDGVVRWRRIDLVEVLGGCGECHTPKGSDGVPVSGQTLAGVSLTTAR